VARPFVFILYLMFDHCHITFNHIILGRSVKGVRPLFYSGLRQTRHRLYWIEWLSVLCINDVLSWMRSNRLQLNTAKTEALWCASARQQHLIPSDPVSVCSDLVMPAKYVRDLGIYIDCDMSMKNHASRTALSCFAALRQIRSCLSLRRWFRQDWTTAELLSVVFPGASWIDYSQC